MSEHQIQVVGVTGGTVGTLNIAGSVTDKKDESGAHGKTTYCYFGQKDSKDGEKALSKRDEDTSSVSSDVNINKLYKPKHRIHVTGVSGGTVGTANVAGIVHGGMGNTTVNTGVVFKRNAYQD